MMRAFETFVGEPLRRRNFDLALFRVSQLMHERTNGGFDALYMSAAKTLRRKVELPPSPQMPSDEIAAIVAQLRRDGYMILPKPLPAADVEAICNFAFSTPGVGNDLTKSISITREDIPKGAARYYWWMDQLAAVSAVQRMMADGPYCAIAQEYLGCRPILAHLDLFLDRPFEGKYEPYSYHYDNDGPGFLKFFFFLTDVEIGTGAHYFMAGSQAHTKPPSLAKATLYDSEPLYRQYGQDKEVIVRGPAGTILAEDTSGFHRGSKLERGFRLMMQWQFSVIDLPTDQELHRKLKPVRVPGLHPNIAAITRKFMIPA